MSSSSLRLLTIKIIKAYDDDGNDQDCDIGPTSWITSRWQDQTSLIASGVPMPAALGSPAGPNLWSKNQCHTYSRKMVKVA